MKYFVKKKILVERNYKFNLILNKYIYIYLFVFFLPKGMVILNDSDGKKNICFFQIDNIYIFLVNKNMHVFARGLVISNYFIGQRNLFFQR